MFREANVASCFLLQRIRFGSQRARPFPGEANFLFFLSPFLLDLGIFLTLKRVG